MNESYSYKKFLKIELYRMKTINKKYFTIIVKVDGVGVELGSKEEL
jgi:hypothetical protein